MKTFLTCFLISQTIFACQCKPDKIDIFSLYYYNNNDVIFTAYIDSIKPANHLDDIIYFTIDKQFKGSIEESRHTWVNPQGCQPTLEEKTYYLIYADFWIDTVFTTHLCSRTRPLYGSQHEYLMEKLEKKYTEESGMNISFADYEMWALNQTAPNKNENITLHYPNNQINASGKIKEGVFEGSWEFYHIGGSVKAKGHYVKGVKTGEWIESNSYFMFGKIPYSYEKGMYENGEKVGEWKVYDVNHQYLESEFYSDQ